MKAHPAFPQKDARGRIGRLWDGLALVRPTLLLPLWTMQLLGRIHAEGLPLAGSWLRLDRQFLAWCGAHTAMAAAAYILNQWTDVATDAANRKLFLLAEGRVSRRFAGAVAVGCLGIAAVLLVWVPPTPTVGTILILSALLGAGYSVPPVRLKGRAGWDVAANAVGYGFLSFALGWLSLGPPTGGLARDAVPYVLAVAGTFLFTTIPDRAGDEAVGLQTSAVRWGTSQTALAGWLCFWAAVVLAAILGNGRALIAAGWAAVVYAPGVRRIRRTGEDAALVRRTQLGLLGLIFLAGLAFPPFFGVVFAVVVWARWYYRRRFGLRYP